MSHFMRESHNRIESRRVDIAATVRPAGFADSRMSVYLSPIHITTNKKCQRRMKSPEYIADDLTRLIPSIFFIYLPRFGVPVGVAKFCKPKHLRFCFIKSMRKPEIVR